MEFSVKSCVFIVVATCSVALAQQRIEIDTYEDLISTSGWQVECSQGYQRNLSDFQCNRVSPGIPADDLNGELGFWAGCGSTCVLTYTLRSTDVGFGFRAYTKDMPLIIRKNGKVDEYYYANRWVEDQVDLSFVTSISFRLTPYTKDAFVVLDKIFIQPEIGSTATPPTNGTTVAPPTNGTTVAPPTNGTTVVPPTNGTTVVPPILFCSLCGKEEISTKTIVLK